MLRLPFVTRANGRAGIGSALALALSLAGGAAVGTIALTEPALAQRNSQQQGPTLSRGFQPLYQAVADATNTTGDYPAAKAQVPAMIAAIASQYDRFFAGNIMLQLGSKASDRALQKQGLELMLASGQGSPNDNGLFHYFLGSMAYDGGDYATALSEAQASLATGYMGNFAQQQDPWLLQVDSLAKLGRHQESMAFLKSAIEQRSAAGLEVREGWLVRGLATSYEQRNAADAVDWATLLIKSKPTETSWLQALQVINELATVDPKVRLDVYRLMALTGSLRERADFARYVEYADPRAMSNEVGRVLQAAVAANAFAANDDYYVEIKQVVDANAAKDRADAPTLAREARAANGTARAAQNAGDVYLSLEAYAEAEEMFALGLQKPGADRDLMLTRLGIAQVHQGKLAEAKATFAQVSGERAAVARMWSAYIDSRA